jgi:hypothetical protein
MKKNQILRMNYIFQKNLNLKSIKFYFFFFFFYFFLFFFRLKNDKNLVYIFSVEDFDKTFFPFKKNFNITSGL